MNEYKGRNFSWSPHDFWLLSIPLQYLYQRTSRSDYSLLRGNILLLISHLNVPLKCFYFHIYLPFCCCYCTAQYRLKFMMQKNGTKIKLFSNFTPRSSSFISSDAYNSQHDIITSTATPKQPSFCFWYGHKRRWIMSHIFWMVY